MPLDLISKIVTFRVKESLGDGNGEDFLSLVSAPARRALENKGIKTLQELSEYSEAELLELHGMGPGAIPKLRGALQAAGLSFRGK